MTLTTSWVGLAVVSLAMIAGGDGRTPQAPADAAAKFNGSWVLNKELSPSLESPPAGGRGRRGGGALFSLAVPQRGGRGGGGGGGASGPEPANMMPEEAAAQAALDVLHQVAIEFRIEATATTISFIEPRGQLDYKIDGKTSSLSVPGGAIKVKSRWDHGALRQEFSSTQRSLIKSWAIDGDGRLVLTEHVESVAFMSKPSKAVYDRK